MNVNWQIQKIDIHLAKRLSRILKIDIITASVLANRGISSPEDAYAFIHASPESIAQPFVLKDMDKAVQRIENAIYKNEKVLIFGDYDADGLTAVTILMEFLNAAGADVSYYIPDRVNEGYGLKSLHIETVAVPQEIDLIITVDCGISSHNAAILAKENGIDLIITDHHAVGDTLPDAYCIVNPKRSDCGSGLTHLAGVGVAFYLLLALRKTLRGKGFFQDRREPNLKNMCDLVAIGTIADIVPLVTDNRVITKLGIDILRQGKRPGLAALMEISKTDIRNIASDDIAFKLAPRINSAGRISHSKIIIDLFTEKNPKRALETAKTIDDLNVKRKEIETGIQSQIDHFLKNNPIGNRKAIILAGNNWHTGVLGILCSRLISRYYKPVILLSINDGKGTGSGRSIPGFDLHNALLSCADNLEKFGGHKMAAGLTVSTDKLKPFIDQFENTVAETEIDMTGTLDIDYRLNFSDITPRLIDELELLDPFGDGNAEPVFVSDNIKVKSSTIIGGNHIRYVLYQDNGHSNRLFNAIHFNSVKPGNENLSFDQIAYKLKWNRYNGKKTMQLEILDVKNSSCIIKS